MYMCMSIWLEGLQRWVCDLPMGYREGSGEG